jgi:D-alanine-D-alanine ligase
MKIVVLAGGLSDERNVSLSSGTMVAEALRERGHEVALVDMFLGLEDHHGAI